METLRRPSSSVEPVATKELLWLQENVAVARARVSFQWRGPTESFCLPSGPQDLCLSTNLCKEGPGVLHDPPVEASVRHDRREMVARSLALSRSMECLAMAKHYPEGPLTLSESRLNSDECGGQSNTMEGGVSPSLTPGVPLDRQEEVPISLGQQEIQRPLETLIPSGKSKPVGHLERQKQLQSPMQCTASTCLNPWHLRGVSKLTMSFLDPLVGSLYPIMSDGQTEQSHSMEAPNLLQMFFDTHWWRRPHQLSIQLHPQVMSFPSTVSCVWKGGWSSSCLTITTDPGLPLFDRAVAPQHSPSVGLGGVSLAIPSTEIVSQVEPQSQAVCEAFNVCSSNACPCSPDSTSHMAAPGAPRKRKAKGCHLSTPQKRQKRAKGKRKLRTENPDCAAITHDAASKCAFEPTLSSLWMAAEEKQGVKAIEEGDLLTSEDGALGCMLISNAATHSPLVCKAYLGASTRLNVTEQTVKAPKWDVNIELDGLAPDTFESSFEPLDPLDHFDVGVLHIPSSCHSSFPTYGLDPSFSSDDFLANQWVCSRDSSCTLNQFLESNLKADGLCMKDCTMFGLGELLLGSIFETESKFSEEVERFQPVVATIDSCSELCQNIQCNVLPILPQESFSSPPSNLVEKICSADSIRACSQLPDCLNTAKPVSFSKSLIAHTLQEAVQKEVISQETVLQWTALQKTDQQQSAVQETVLQEAVSQQSVQKFVGVIVAEEGKRHSKELVTVKKCSIPLVRLQFGKSILQRPCDLSRTQAQNEAHSLAQSESQSYCTQLQSQDEQCRVSEAVCTYNVPKEPFNSVSKPIHDSSNLMAVDGRGETHEKKPVAIKNCSVPLFGLKLPLKTCKAVNGCALAQPQSQYEESQMQVQVQGAILKVEHLCRMTHPYWLRSVHNKLLQGTVPLESEKK